MLNLPSISSVVSPGMQFRIADTFTDSLARLTGDEQKAVKTTAFDLQLNPASPGMSFHRLDRAKDKHFWSVWVNTDLRLIVHRTDSSLLLCYVDHHDKAYAWAERRVLSTHPRTGAAQLVELRETVQEISVPVYTSRPVVVPEAIPLFGDKSDEELLAYGVPVDWLAAVREATDTTVLEVVEHLPGEAAEALLELATGGKPRTVPVPLNVPDPFNHPDAQRRFRLMTNVEELERALAFPWDKWTVFLHPEQRQWVEREYNGPSRISGSAGTGKTIVALHRAVFLTRQHPDARVLLTTFSDTLANALRTRINRLLSNEPRLAERLDVYSIPTMGDRLYRALIGQPSLASPEQQVAMLTQASEAVEGHKFSLRFLVTEWEQVVDDWQLETWEAYRDVVRLGRKTRLAEPQRAILWSLFERVLSTLREANLLTRSSLFTRLARSVAHAAHAPYDFVVVDEAQDIGVAHLRFFAALGGARPDALFFAGDLGQRIFQQPFSWKALGVDIRGRSRTLRVNYRTSHQIRGQADRLLGPQVSDVDGNTEKRSDTVSVFNGPPPTIQACSGQENEEAIVGNWLSQLAADGIAAHEIGVFVRSSAELERAVRAVSLADLPYRILDDSVDVGSGSVSVGLMNLAKGLEFRAVVVMACDDEVVPLQERIETVGDEADLQEVYDTERHLLYVACTRARDQLLVTGVEPVSEFLADMSGC